MSDQQTASPETHRQWAQQINQRVWELLAKHPRTERENDELLAVAFASYYHWLQAGTGVHLQRAEYLIAKAYLSLNNPAETLSHALKCLRFTEQYQPEMQDFDFAYAYELAARAHAMRGDLYQAKTYYQQAQTAGDAIQNSEDKAIFEEDFASEPWFGLS